MHSVEKTFDEITASDDNAIVKFYRIRDVFLRW